MSKNDCTRWNRNRIFTSIFSRITTCRKRTALSEETSDISDGARRLWTLVDEPLVNQNFETIDEIEEVLIQRCNTLNNMKQEIKDLTNYHWLMNS